MRLVTKALVCSSKGPEPIKEFRDLPAGLHYTLDPGGGFNIGKTGVAPDEPRGIRWLSFAPSPLPEKYLGQGNETLDPLHFVGSIAGGLGRLRQHHP